MEKFYGNEPLGLVKFNIMIFNVKLNIFDDPSILNILNYNFNFNL